MPATYPDCPVIERHVRIGGVPKEKLLANLTQQGVQLNEAGRTLFDRDDFTTSERTTVVRTVELSVADLGFADGAASEVLFQAATQLGLSLCPLELGPHLRLQFMDQPEGHMGYPPPKHCAPPGSLTVASPPLVLDEEVPKGFYLRRIEGVLWLRGYWCGPDHLWSPADRLVFAAGENTAGADT